MPGTDRKRTAVEFLQLAAKGAARQALEPFFAPGAKHHNAFFPAGMAALAKAMEQNAQANPDKILTVKHVLAEGDLVAVHSHVVMRAGDPGFVVVHLFRFAGDEIAELWDVGQQIPADSPNADGVW